MANRGTLQIPETHRLIEGLLGVIAAAQGSGPEIRGLLISAAEAWEGRGSDSALLREGNGIGDWAGAGLSAAQTTGLRRGRWWGTGWAAGGGQGGPLVGGQRGPLEGGTAWPAGGGRRGELVGDRVGRWRGTAWGAVVFIVRTQH